MLFENLKNYKIILASKSPRRNLILNDLGLKFEVRILETDESYPDYLTVEKIPVYLAEKKALPYYETIDDKTIVITADTIVHFNDEILGKPSDYNDAFRMLKILSGNWHQVSTGVCIFSKLKKETFTSVTNVLFKKLSNEEIDYYVTNYKPYDKAGAYGIQEWIGFIAVEQINGSYFNVMGLPIQQLYKVLCKF